MISEEYRDQNTQLHKTNKDYGAYGGKWAPVVMQICAERRTQDVLDYGCGKASLHLQLPFGIHNYDPALPKYSADPGPADIVVCTDVMEHVEPEHTDEVLDDLQRLTRKVLLLNIAIRPAKKTLPDGRNAHLVIESGDWWLAKIKERWKVKTLNMDEKEITTILEPK